MEHLDLYEESQKVTLPVEILTINYQKKFLATCKSQDISETT